MTIRHAHSPIVRERQRQLRQRRLWNGTTERQCTETVTEMVTDERKRKAGNQALHGVFTLSIYKATSNMAAR